MYQFDVSYTVIAYERNPSDLPEATHYIEVDRDDFVTEDACITWADDNGYLDSDLFSVSIEDQDGNVRYL